MGFQHQSQFPTHTPFSLGRLRPYQLFVSEEIVDQIHQSDAQLSVNLPDGPEPHPVH